MDEMTPCGKKCEPLIDVQKRLNRGDEVFTLVLDKLERLEEKVDKTNEIALTFESLRRNDPDFKETFKELFVMFRNYRDAKRATRSAIWAFLRSAGKNLYSIGSKAAAIVALIYLLKKFGVAAENIEQLTKVVK